MHYSVAVIHKESQDVEDLLEPFYEDLKVYWVKSKDQHIAEVRKDIQQYKEDVYNKYLKDPKEYSKNCRYEEHLNYISKEFPLRLQ